MFDRTSLNILLIGSGISASAFGFSLLSTTKLNVPLKYEKASFRGKIESFSDIEDLEFTKGCKFYFYEKLQSDSNVKIRNARNFGISEKDKGNMFKAVEGKIKDCTKNRYFYIKATDINKQQGGAK